MKRKYESIELTVYLLDTQDVITASVYVEWGTDWKDDGNQNGDWTGNIFG